MVFFSIIIYLATSISKNDDKIETEDNLIESGKNEAINTDENYWYSRGWPKNDLSLVRCKNDTDCGLYFYYKTDDPVAIREKANSNLNVQIISDGNSCAWGVINMKHGSLWQERYPKPGNCVLNDSTRARRFCDDFEKVCVNR